MLRIGWYEEGDKMNIAIVPWSKEALGNQMFRQKLCKNHPHDNNVQWLENYNYVRRWFKERGLRYETIDRYKDWDEIDYILIYAGRIHKRYVSEFLRRGYENKLIYIAIEPEIGYKEHRKEKMPKLLRYYKYIITWNKEIADEGRIFQFNLHYVLSMPSKNVPFSERKLLTAIYSAHGSGYGEKELYTERNKIFRCYEKYEGQFDLYGKGWDGFRNYRGIAGNKTDIYCDYRFAIALENMKDRKGYVTEKIYDCICNGIVPIYYGASDIKEYVPADVFIDYSRFKKPDELWEFLSDMPEDIWLAYLEAARRYLESDRVRLIDPKQYCEKLEQLMRTDPEMDIHCRKIDKILFSLNIAGHEILIKLWMKIKKNKLTHNIWYKIKKIF